jgi:hypothetical protein
MKKFHPGREVQPDCDLKGSDICKVYVRNSGDLKMLGIG